MSESPGVDQVRAVVAQALGYLTASVVVAVTVFAVQGWEVFCASIAVSLIAGLLAWRRTAAVENPRTNDIPVIRSPAKAFTLSLVVGVCVFGSGYAGLQYLSHHVDSTYGYVAAVTAVLIGALFAAVGARLLALTRRQDAPLQPSIIGDSR